jgi:putative FmdB family regulatory protein
MPLYPFFCKKCEKNFELFIRLSESQNKVTCPYCQGGVVESLSDKEQDDLTPGVCGVKKDT